MDAMAADSAIVLGALVLEACIGYPRALLTTIGHPVTWMGRVLERLERHWNDHRNSERTRRFLGILTVVIVAGSAAVVAGRDESARCAQPRKPGAYDYDISGALLHRAHNIDQRE